MAINQTAIANERESLKAEIGELEVQLKTKRALYKEYNTLSALLGGPPPSSNGKRKHSSQRIKGKCTLPDCNKPKNHIFPTQAVLTRHIRYDHGVDV